MGNAKTPIVNCDEYKKLDDKGRVIMKKVRFLWLCILFFLSLQGCKSSSKAKPRSVTKGEYIYRHHNEELFVAEPLVKTKRSLYPWESENKLKFPKITKEFFRCKGNLSNPVKIVDKGSEPQYIYDCGGIQQHSLPIRDGKEFVYPILIDLLNYLQLVTSRRVVITSGHCCLEHNTYLDPSPSNRTSKHLLAAEVDFYIEGMEEEPEKVVDWIQAYYKVNPKYKGLKEYLNFERFKKMDKTNVATQPWFNKEIFVKLMKRTERRDVDNEHKYPYVSVQVRYDWELQENVHYNWEKAFRGFYRK